MVIVEIVAASVFGLVPGLLVVFAVRSVFLR